MSEKVLRAIARCHELLELTKAERDGIRRHLVRVGSSFRTSHHFDALTHHFASLDKGEERVESRPREARDVVEIKMSHTLVDKVAVHVPWPKERKPFVEVTTVPLGQKSAEFRRRLEEVIAEINWPPVKVTNAGQVLSLPEDNDAAVEVKYRSKKPIPALIHSASKGTVTIRAPRQLAEFLATVIFDRSKFF